MDMDYVDAERDANYTKVVYHMPFNGYRQNVAYIYIGFNIIGFVINTWVMYVIGPLLFSQAVKVPKSILFYILSLCILDLLIMCGMLLLIIELAIGTWTFPSSLCSAYLMLDGLNKFIAPIIVFLISRACYSTVCLEKRASDRAAGLKYAMLQVLCCVGGVLVLCSPILVYSEVQEVIVSRNNTTNTAKVLHKCGFYPPALVTFWWNIIACTLSYAIPLCGIIYWYVSVPIFLKRRAVSTLVTSSKMDAAMRKVVTTVIVLTAIYVICWTPYWFTMLSAEYNIMPRLITDRTIMITVSYVIHLLPYVSCSAYPLIFTLMNRGIKVAHAKRCEDSRRRLRTATGEASSYVRTATTTLRRTTLTARSSFLEVTGDGTCRKTSANGVERPRGNISPISKAAESAPASPPETVVISTEDNEGETLL